MIPPLPVGVLLGGGIESTLLVRRFLADGQPVVPVHVHCGLIWDDCESGYVRRFCAACADPGLSPLIEIRVPLNGFLKGHWAVTGEGVPRAGGAAADLEIPLRNLTLLGFALHGLLRSGHLSDGPIGEDFPHVEGTGPSTFDASNSLVLALGTTADNCYRDGSRAYFDKCQEILSLESGGPVVVMTPLIGLNKTEVIRASDPETLALSFSCVSPQRDLHCGRCIKCGRRRAAFQAARVADPTVYVHAKAQ